MRKYFLIFFFFYPVLNLLAQQTMHNNLYDELSKTSNDTLKLFLLDQIGSSFIEKNWDSASYYEEKSLLLSKEIHFSLMQAYLYDLTGYINIHMGNFSQALTELLAAIDIAQNPANDNVSINNNINEYFKYYETNDPSKIRLHILGWCHLHLGHLYGSVGSYADEIKQYFICENYWHDKTLLTYVFMNLGNGYLNMNRFDSALYYENKAYQLANADNFTYYFKLLKLLGIIHTRLGNYSEAKKYFYQDLATDRSSNKNDIYTSLGLLYLNMGIKDSALYFANLGNQLATISKAPEDIIYARSLLADVYDSLHIPDSTLKYQRQVKKLQDSTFSAQKLLNFQQVYFDDQARKKKMEEAKKNYQNKLRVYTLIAALVILIIATVFLMRNIKMRKKTNAQLQQQKKELELSLAQLKSTQSQLIQSEKMASLGELTAGIAHEIQNPLNFVNNFSDVNRELADELEQEIDEGKYLDAKATAGNIKDNEEKINHHGKRADAIVKGMLQHSRTSSGQKESTDINVLVDEYLRLAYHGFRAKEKSFNAEIKTEFDNSVGKISIIPQEISRVILNLINNAFYAVNEKQKQNLDGYEPLVTVSTVKQNGKVEIKVKDNGNGIPQKIVDKIFQPFFTTKPTGQGTGLGLSLAYDIVKAHGGEIKVQSKEGEGSEFVIQLPLNKAS